jgi:site-specific recombinase XerD
MLQRGVAIEVVSRMLGHTSVATTERVYAHHTVEWLREAASASEG